MDALPVEEVTGLPYASVEVATDSEGNQVPVMHDCGHDMRVTWLAGTISLLARVAGSWNGTVVAVFQPAEETAQGAQAMIDDGRPRRSAPLTARWIRRKSHGRKSARPADRGLEAGFL